MPFKTKTMDGNEAAAYASYAFTEVAAIYPITPSSPMAEFTDEWASKGKKNIFGQSVKLVEMQSEAGAISAVHGALDSGALATSYTSSQGLMLMIPTMYRIAGQLKPCVLHVASRTVATNNISIFAEQSDVMACRQTGFAMLASSSVQEAMDMAAVAHLAAIKGHVPFMHFFDGFRTSHEIQKVRLLDYEDLKGLVDYKELERFKKDAQNPEHPRIRTSGLNGDTYFQAREAMNSYYDAIPEIVEEQMEKINKIAGTNYHLFDYYGPNDPDYLIVSMGSVAGTIEESIDYLNSKGKKYGFINIHLFRPFSLEKFISLIPESVKAITAMDRNKEPGAMGEPLYEEISSAIRESGRDIDVYACRFGLASKDTTPSQIRAIYENMEGRKKSHFTIGINDDVTNLSLPYKEDLSIIPQDTVSCKFWGLGGDGTVGANKNSIKIIGDHTDKNVQAYFEYDGKKSGGVTRSHLRFGDSPIRATYLVNNADFVAVHSRSYVAKYDITGDLKDGGSLLLAAPWSDEDLDKHLPSKMKRDIANKHIKLYIIDSDKIAEEIGMGKRTNTILQAAFFSIANIIPREKAEEYMKEAALKSYGSKGDAVVNMNYKAIERGLNGYREVLIPNSWKDATDEKVEENLNKPSFIKNILEPVNNMKGDDIPVSAFLDYADGTFPVETSRWEKRGTAVFAPVWDSEKCIECNMCSYVCPHAVIRPFLVTKEEAEKAGVKAKEAKGIKEGNYLFTMGISSLDCQGCASCAVVCPAKALTMKPLEEAMESAKAWSDLIAIEERNPIGKNSVKGSQFETPLLEFSGACAGCGETPYAKLVTQLFGKRMYVATATGCSQVWATSFPSFPYAKDKKGRGPAVSGSLFENNAEFGLGIMLGAESARSRTLDSAKSLLEKTENDSLKAALSAYIEGYEENEGSLERSEALKSALNASSEGYDEIEFLKKNTDQFVKKSVWMFGGDGWAYDIGYGGLDHVIASGADVNILIFDTEVYSNTGGQASKATPTGAVAQFAASGKRRKKKDLGAMAMSYKDVYVAQVAMGANYSQLLKALLEAESYKGPSIVICYAPCINHGLKCGMSDVMGEMKRAVECGYWQLYRYDPRRIEENLNPFQLDMKDPSGDFRAFLLGETRYASLKKANPEMAEELFIRCEKEAKERYAGYKKLALKED